MNSVPLKMLYTTLLILAGSMMVSSAPVFTKRASNDLLVLQFANVLEQFENGFYTQALNQFQDADFTAAGFASSQIPLEQLVTIQQDEQTHLQVLQAVIKDFGGTPITSCRFNFGPALQNVPTMMNIARIIEDVGLGAYLGAAHLISDPVLLTAAGSIMTVEARHQTVLNILSGTGTAIPAAFDIPLKPEEVLAIVSPFFSGPCNLGIQPNTNLIITNQGPVQPGTMLTFQSSALNASTNANSLFCQMMTAGAPFSLSLPLSQCVVPGGVNGPVAVYITKDNQPIANDVVNRNPNSLIAGPTILYVDTDLQMLGHVVVNGGNQTSGSGSGSDSFTRTVSPSVASAIANGASSPPPAPTPTTFSSGAPVPTNAPSNAGFMASGSVSASPPAQTFVGTPGGQNDFTGSTPGGIRVNGWSKVSMPSAVAFQAVPSPPTTAVMFVGTPGGQNNFVGTTPGGISVNGWAMVAMPH